MMPKMDGPSLAEKLKMDPRTHSIPIIFLTALVKKDEEYATNNRIGGNLFMAKPFDPKDLIIMVNNVLIQKL
jgi:putative two-component system response regulator